MRDYSYTVTEYETDRPWIIVATGRDRVQLDDRVDFHAWAAERFPRSRYKVALDHQPQP